MICYVMGYAITMLFCWVSNDIKKRRCKIFFQFLSCIPFILIAGLRGKSVGIDTNLNYIPMYNIAVNYGESIDFFNFFSVKYTFGFTAIMYFFSRFFVYPNILFTFCSIIIIGFTFYAIYRESKIPWLSITIFFLSGDFVLTMNGMRGFMGIAIVLYSIKYIKSRDWRKFIFLIFLAGIIHSATFGFILLYPIYMIRLKKLHIVGCLLGVPFLLLFGRDMLSILLKNTSFINYFDASSVMVNPLYTMLVINIIVFGLFYLNYENHKDDREYNFYLKIQLLSVIVCIMSFVLPHSFRLEQFVDYFQIITIPFNLFLLKGKRCMKAMDKRCLMLLTIAMFAVYFVKVFVMVDDNQIKNYVTFFEDGY